MLASSGEDDPALRRAGQARREATMLFDNPGPQERADQAQHLAVGDALGDQAHQDLVIDIVEAGLDVALDHPLVGRRLGEVVDLGDGILGPPSRPIPVTVMGRSRPRRSVPGSASGPSAPPGPAAWGSPKRQFPALLRYRHLPDRQRNGSCRPAARSAAPPGTAPPRCPLRRGERVTASTPAVPAPRLPDTRSQATNRVARSQTKLNTITEPAYRFGSLPIGAACAGDRVPDARRPNSGQLVDAPLFNDSSPPRSLLITLPPFPMLRSSPGARSTTAAPPRPDAHSGRHACPPTGWMPAGEGGTGSFPTFTDVRCDGVGAQLYPGGIAAGRTSQSWPGPPAAQITQPTEERAGQKPRPTQHRRATHPPDSTGR